MSIYASTPQTTETLDQLGGGTGLAKILENTQDELDTFSISTVDNLTITESASSSNYLAWGDDVKLYRSSENVLTLAEGDEMQFIGSADSNAVLKAWTQGNSAQGFELLADGKMQWGGGSGAADTNLYRDGDDTLRSDDTITAYNFIAANTNVTIYSAGGELEFGDGAGNNDTNLYRDSANTLKTDDAFIAGTSLAIASSSAMTDIKDEDDMSSNSDTALATQQSIKAYHDADMPTGDVVGTTDTQTLTNKTLDTPTFVGVDGWIDADESWSYSAWDDTNGVSTASITVPSDATTKYQEGMRVKFDQTTDGTKYGIITKVESTTLTVFMNTDYDFDNETISNSHYSPMKAPLGFDLDSDKWSVETTSSSTLTSSNVTEGDWANPGSLSIDIPIGDWNVKRKVAASVAGLGSISWGSGYVTLSTSDSSESDSDYTAEFRADGGNSSSDFSSFLENISKISLSTKDTYYLLIKHNVDGSPTGDLSFRGGGGTTIIRAECAYL